MLGASPRARALTDKMSDFHVLLMVWAAVLEGYMEIELKGRMETKTKAEKG